MDTKWTQIKLSKIHPRSHGSGAIYQNKLYLYGGQSNIIHSDFLEIDLNSFGISIIEDKSKQSPGPLAKHKSIVIEDRFYILGGQTPIGQSNQVGFYDFKKQLWELNEVNDTYPLPFDGHAICQVNDNCLALFGGFFDYQLSNTLYQYDTNNNQFSILSQTNCPSPREGCSLNYYRQKYFVFGGTDFTQKFDDLWIFDKNWIQFKSVTYPKARSGHTMNNYKDKLILFGGIHSVTWELDDLWCFNDNWHQLQSDSSRKLSRSQEKKLNAQHFQTETVITYSPRQSKYIQSLTAVQIKRQKQLTFEKTQFLKALDSEDQEQLIIDTPSTIKMRSSLLQLGAPISLQYSDFGRQIESKFQKQIETHIITNDKRPCARDGHITCIWGDKLVIFGGDRHKMQFNDLNIIQVGLMQL